MDGTLLNSEKELSINTIPLFEKVLKKGIKIGIASGRQYQNIRTYFPTLADQLLFVSENGTYIVDQNEVIYESALPLSFVSSFVRTYQKKEIALVLCSGEIAYLLEATNEQRAEINKYYSCIKEISSVDEITHHIIKIAILDLRGSEEFTYPSMKDLQDVEVTLSAHHWVDISNKAINKGSAIQTLKKKYQLHKDECMAFGDYLNDLSMMNEVTYSFGMKEGHPDLLKVCKYSCENQDVKGIDEVLESLLQEQSMECYRRHKS